MTPTVAAPPPAASSGRKQLVIKPLKEKPALPADFEDATWAKLKEAIHAVHYGQPVSTSLEELYAAVQDLCIHKMAERLYQRLQAECDAQVSRQVAQLEGDLQLDPLAFLDKVDAAWRDHCSQMLTLRHIFLYLDRTHVLAATASQPRSLFDMGLQLLGRRLAGRPEIERRAVEGLLILVDRERRGSGAAGAGGGGPGSSGGRATLQSLLRMLRSLGTYPETFQRPFLDQSAAFYRDEGARLVGEIGVPAYLLHCETRLSEEYQRCNSYLDASTRKPLIQVVEQQLVSEHLPAILTSTVPSSSSPTGTTGLADLVENHRVTDMARLYRLANRVGSLDALRCALRDHVRESGGKMVKDEEKDKDMVERLLEFKARLDTMLALALNKNEAFATSLKEAFESFVNQRQNKPAELIAKYIDGLLKTGGQHKVSAAGAATALTSTDGGADAGGAAATVAVAGGGTGGGGGEDDLESLLDRILVLFRYIQGKDVFEAFYKKDLAKRLLVGKSASVDAEKSMISKLKAECGAQFTSKLEGMFKDIELSSDVMSAFRQSQVHQSRLPPGVDMAVHVLTSGFWPTYPQAEAKLPQELEQAQETFKDFYLKKYSGRKLVWHASLGTCVIKAAFPKGEKELNVSLFQAVVLSLFSGSETLSLADLQTQSGIEDKELRRTLQSLACGQVRVLTKEPKGREVDDDDVFHFNAEFTDKRYRIKINSIQLKETAEENKKTNDEVLQDRQYQIDAAIVRIMKTRKQLSHKLLISEVVAQLKFPLKAADLKKRIESLIDREYLARDSADQNIYNYLA